MGKLNESFDLCFHEIGQEIGLFFTSDATEIPIGCVEENLCIPVVFEESTSRIPVIIADHEEIEAQFAEYYGNPGGVIDTYTRAEIDAFLARKQGKLTAGPTIFLQDNYIDTRFIVTDVSLDF